MKVKHGRQVHLASAGIAGRGHVKRSTDSTAFDGRLRGFAEVGVNHFMCSVSQSVQWPNYFEAIELLAREVAPRVRR